MPIWDQLRTKTQTINDQLKTKKDQFRSKEFADATMAMCALVAAADGSIDATERQKTAALIVSNDVLSVFAPDDLRTKFDAYCDKLARDFDFGKVEAIAAIAKLKSKPDQARAVVSIGLIIGGADGSFDADERKVVKEACYAVGIEPAEFDL
ncbi:tellurite resistance TerB family protein [uncultured Jatrophihabitans sp.]|uniref:tellurite resistance TerB family protein n=1 Tax=uncultured Jatrophihabitans sp. TaxID=1610747 RepID=UPI0035CB02CF